MQHEACTYRFAILWHARALILIESIFLVLLRYVKSRSDYQLLHGLKHHDLGSCAPEDVINGLPVVPCGLIAWSMFNDTFSFFRGVDEVKIDRKNIAWKSDRDHKFGKDVYPFNFQNGTLIGGARLDPNIPVSDIIIMSIHTLCFKIINSYELITLKYLMVDHAKSTFELIFGLLSNPLSIDFFSQSLLLIRARMPLNWESKLFPNLVCTDLSIMRIIWSTLMSISQYLFSFFFASKAVIASSSLKQIDLYHFFFFFHVWILFFCCHCWYKLFIILFMLAIIDPLKYET